MSRIPLHPLQGFALAAKLRNLTRAADALHLTVSALSHQIRALEQRLGQRLFDRGPRGLTLTADGQRLYDAVAQPLGALEQALRPSTACRDDVLTLSLLPSMASGWLVPRLPDFLARHPQLEINLQSSVALVDFERDHAVDAALRYGPGHWPGLIATPLFDEWMTPLASPALLARLGHKLALDDLGRYPLLDDSADRWSDWFRQYGGSPPKRFVASFDDTETLQRAASAGLGIAMGRITMARPLIEAGLLVELCPCRLKSEYGHYLVHPQRSHDHAGLQSFRTWIIDQASRYAASLEQTAATRAPRPSARKKPADPGMVVKKKRR